MNKTINISLNGVHFNIDENAYGKLKHYLEQLRHSLRNEEGKDEIMQDIETRIAELFKQYLGIGRDVVSEQDVDKVISVMGEPEDYIDEENTQNENAQSSSQNTHSYSSQNTYSSENGGEKTIVKKLYRDLDEKILGGVYAGISHNLGWSPTILRIIMTFLLLLSFFTDLGISAFFWIISYCILWIIIPPAITNIQKLQMYGEPVNVDSIKKSVTREELNDTMNNVKGYTRDAVNTASPYVESVAQNIFKILKGLLGLFLIITGIGGFIGSFGFLISALVSNNLIFNFGDFIFDHQWKFYAFVICIFLMIISLSILSIYAGIRLISTGREYPNSTSFIVSFVALFFIGLLGTAILGASTAMDFNDEVSYFEKDELKFEGDSLYVQFAVNRNQSFVLKNRGFNSNIGFNKNKDSMIIPISNDLEVCRSLDNYFYIEKIYSSRGKTEDDAADNIQAISYKYQLKGNHLDLEEEIKIPNQSKFRDQKVTIKLYVPEDKTLIMNNVDDIESCEFEDNDRWYNHEDEIIVFQTKNHSIKCLSCDNFDDDWDSDDEDYKKDKNGNINIQGDDGQVIINDDSIQIQSKDKDVQIKIKDK